MMRQSWITGSAILIAGVILTAAAQSTLSTSQGVYSAAQAERGHALYERVCATCHQSDLRGNEEFEVPALSGEHFDRQWRGEPIAALFRKINTTMPASAPGSLSPRETAELIAYLLQVNHAPAGLSDLPADAVALNAIVIAADAGGGRPTP